MRAHVILPALTTEGSGDSRSCLSFAQLRREAQSKDLLLRFGSFTSGGAGFLAMLSVPLRLRNARG
jgi:hypothetical protein